MESSIIEVLSIICMSLALGMDAFSVGLAMGMREIRLKRIAMIGLVVGIFHIIMPFIGLLLGALLSNKIEGIAMLASGLLLCAIGIQMIIHTFQKKDNQILEPIGFGVLIFAFTVSLDSFSIGISLGLSGLSTALVIMMFGMMSTVLTWLALLIGRKTHRLLGTYSELFGGAILCAFGLNVLL
ncbi:manganese efflux pump MntP family protein [Gracilibacillus sp. S3-1-1]|uniref:Manganese efflux pump MntP family protein n=1 Tax=Gracilibacillus pellucidus TaxID=3095368 RepID=A0ACC6MA72_9BACI|nr:manganese efflux pump MntP family protein [Gracilibacillus sp. S3-1-1]MDX8047727.1 manganese efflux pump MntP family protein [Gracilibacillus sp. S3-1-1]